MKNKLLKKFINKKDPQVKAECHEKFKKYRNLLSTFSLFQEEINAYAAIHTHYVMDACDRVQPTILLPPMMGMSFLLVALTRLIVREPKH